MEKKKKDFRKYPIGFLAVFVSAVLMLTMFNALAATTVNVGIEDLEVTAGDYVTPSDVSSTGFTATIYGGHDNCSGPFSRTGSVTFNNTSDRNYVLSFEYNITGNVANINGESLSGSGSKEVKIGANQTLSMNITSPVGQNKNTVVSISNLTYVPIATAAYEQVGEDYEPTSDGDKTASLWKVNVIPGTDAVTELNVEVNGRRAAEALKSDTAFSGEGGIVFGVVLNKGAADVESFKVLVNGVAVD